MTKTYCRVVSSNRVTVEMFFFCARPPRNNWRWLIDLKVRRGGAILPAAHRLDDCGAAQRARPLSVEPLAQAVLAEDMLAEQSHGVSEVRLADGTHISRLSALLAAGPHAIALRAAEDDQGFTNP